MGTASSVTYGLLRLLLIGHSLAQRSLSHTRAHTHTRALVDSGIVCELLSAKIVPLADMYTSNYSRTVACLLSDAYQMLWGVFHPVVFFNSTPKQAEAINWGTVFT